MANTFGVIKIKITYYRLLSKNAFRSTVADDAQTASSTNNSSITGVTTVTTTNSTQTPSDLSPPPPNGDEILPHAHHQNPGHCKESFAAINQMRQNVQVSI